MCDRSSFLNVIVYDCLLLSSIFRFPAITIELSSALTGVLVIKFPDKIYEIAIEELSYQTPLVYLFLYPVTDLAVSMYFKEQHKKYCNDVDFLQENFLSNPDQVLVGLHP